VVANTILVFVEGWLLENPEWKYDIQPEVLDGKNVADFIDVDIMEKLEALEREEEKLEAEGFYQSDDEEIVSGHGRCCGLSDRRTDDNLFAQIGSDEEEIRDAAKQISEKKALLKKLSQSKNTLKNRPVLPRKTQHVSLKQFTTGMRQIGLDPKHLEKRAEVLVAKEKEAYEAFQAENGGDAQDGMDVDGEAGPSISGKTGRSRAIAERRAPRTDRRYSGMTTSTVRDYFALPLLTVLESDLEYLVLPLHSKMPRLPSSSVWVDDLRHCLEGLVRVIVTFRT
jgi:nucleolar GTP-binding protein